MTIEAIAARAGAGRQTVYRWWSSRSAVVADAIVEGYLGLAVIVIPDDGTLKADLKSWLVSTSEALTDPLALPVVRGSVIFTSSRFLRSSVSSAVSRAAS